MFRPLCIEFPGGIFHGDRHEPIFEDDVDRESPLTTVPQAMQRFDAEVLAHCLVDVPSVNQRSSNCDACIAEERSAAGRRPDAAFSYRLLGAACRSWLGVLRMAR